MSVLQKIWEFIVKNKLIKSTVIIFIIALLCLTVIILKGRVDFRYFKERTITGETVNIQIMSTGDKK